MVLERNPAACGVFYLAASMLQSQVNSLKLILFVIITHKIIISTDFDYVNSLF